MLLKTGRTGELYEYNHIYNCYSHFIKNTRNTMKMACKTCGCHFGDEFKQTLIPPCNFWGDLGLGTIPIKLKRKIWKGVNMIPFDEVAGYKIHMGVNIAVTPIDPSTQWENVDPNYVTLNDEQRREYQRNFFKKQMRGQQPSVIKPEVSIKSKERVVN